jgi:hypothetical protein
MIPEGNPGEKGTANISLCQKWEHIPLPPEGLQGGQEDKLYHMFK